MAASARPGLLQPEGLIRSEEVTEGEPAAHDVLEHRGVVGRRHPVAAEHVELPADDPVHRHVRRAGRRRKQTHLHVAPPSSERQDAGAAGLGRPQRVDAHRRTTPRPVADRCDHGIRPDRGVDHLLGAEEEGPFERGRRDVDGADACPAARATSTAASPTPPQPSTTTASPGTTPARADHRPVCRGHPAAQPGRRPRVEVVRQLDQVGVGGMDDDELGERPGVGEARLPLVRAHLAGAGHAHLAPAAGHDERRGDPAPDPRAGPPPRRPTRRLRRARGPARAGTSRCRGRDPSTRASRCGTARSPARAPGHLRPARRGRAGR